MVLSMNSVLDNFLREMSLLKLYINFQDESYRNQYRIEQEDSNSEVRDLTIPIIKQFDFKSHIISIYGAYEHFVEQLLEKYLIEICLLFDKYELLPSEIKNNNLSKTLGMMKVLGHRKNKNLKAEDLIKVLHNNINNNISEINIEAFKVHTSNFRISSTETYFSGVGIKNISNIIRSYEPIKSHLSNNDSDYLTRESNITFQTLEDICDLRNDISHGVDNIQLIHKSILFENIEFMKIYTQSLYELVNDSFLKEKYELNEKNIDIINIYDNKILCFNTKREVITKDSKIIVKSENHYPNFFLADIIDIQFDKESIESTNLEESINIGVSLNKRIKDTMSFKLLNI